MSRSCTEAIQVVILTTTPVALTMKMTAGYRLSLSPTTKHMSLGVNVLLEIEDSQDPTDDDEEADASDSELLENEAVEEKNNDSDASSDTDEIDVDPRAFKYGQRCNYGEDCLSDEEDLENFSSFRKKRNTKLHLTNGYHQCLRYSIACQEIFQFSRKLPFMIYDSPR